MPTLLHDQFIDDVRDEIKLQLKSIQGSSATFAKQIRSPGSATIKFRDKEYGKHDPDALTLTLTHRNENNYLAISPC